MEAAMIEKQIAEIANFLWMKSIDNISSLFPKGGSSKLNVKDYYYLTVIAAMDQPRISDISDALGLTRPAITALVKRLESAGLLTKTQSASDGRVFFVALTDAGRAIVEGDTRLYERFGLAVRKSVSRAKLRELEALLATVYAEMKKGENDEDA
jgi:DNA-binding MarR family transcriptional regulator